MNTNKNHLKHQQLVRSIYRKMQKHKKPYQISSNNLYLTVLPNVFSPKYFTDSAWFAKEIATLVADKTFLEIGVGTGIVALSAAKNGATVTGVDINPTAVKNTILNFEKHNLSANILLSDMYAALPKKSRYDVIFWNHPFNKGKRIKETFLLRSGFDYQYKSLKNYIKESHKHLSIRGKLLLGTGNVAEIDEIKRIASKFKYKLFLLKKIIMPLELNSKATSDKEPNDYRIYQLKKIEN